MGYIGEAIGEIDEAGIERMSEGMRLYTAFRIQLDRKKAARVRLEKLHSDGAPAADIAAARRAYDVAGYAADEAMNKWGEWSPSP